MNAHQDGPDVDKIGIVAKLAIGHNGPITVLNYDGDYLYSGTCNNDGSTVIVWQEHAREDQLDLRWVASLCHPCGVTAIASMWDLIITATTDGRVHVWRKRDWAHTNTLLGHKKQVTRLLWDGDLLFSSSLDGHVCMWDPDIGECRGRLIHPAAVIDLAADDTYLYAAVDDGTVWIWDQKAKKRVKKLEVDGEIARIVAGNEHIIVATKDGWIRAWKTEDWTKMGETKAHEKTVSGLLLSGQYLYSCSSDGTAKQWIASTLSLQSQISSEQSFMAITKSRLVYLGGPDGTIYGWGSPQWLPIEKARHRIRIYDTAGFYLKEFHRYTATEEDGFIKVMLDEANVYAGTSKGRLCIWDRKTFKLLARLEGQGNMITSMDQDDRYVYTVERRGSVKVWDKQKRECLTSIDMEEDDESVVRITVDDQFVYICSSHDGAKLIEKETWRLTRTIPVHNGAITCIANDNDYLYMGIDAGLIEVWRKDGWERVKTLRGHFMPVVGFAFDKDNLYSLPRGPHVRVWSKSNWECVQEIRIAAGGGTAIAVDERFIYTSTAWKTGVIEVFSKSTFERVQLIETGWPVWDIAVHDQIIYCPVRNSIDFWVPRSGLLRTQQTPPVKSASSYSYGIEVPRPIDWQWSPHADDDANQIILSFYTCDDVEMQTFDGTEIIRGTDLDYIALAYALEDVLFFQAPLVIPGSDSTCPSVLSPGFVCGAIKYTGQILTELRNIAIDYGMNSSVEIRLNVSREEESENLRLAIRNTLDLAGLGLTQVDVFTIQSLWWIERLLLSDNMLKELDLFFVRRLINLRVLRLDNNRLQELNLEPLAECSNLIEINLKGNNIERLDISPLFECPQLRLLETPRSTVLVAYDHLRDLLHKPSAIQRLIDEDGIKWIRVAEPL